VLLTVTKHDLEKLLQLADRITDVLFAGANAVTLVEPAKALFADSQLASIINRVIKLETRLSRSTFRKISGRTVRSRKTKLIVAGTSTLLIIKSPSICNLVAGNWLKNRGKLEADGG